jgi:hypothetical protein
MSGRPDHDPTTRTHRPAERGSQREIRGPAVHSYEYDLAVDRLRELRAEADTAARARRLRAARRWARRAEYATRRAARASAAVR